jgi:hypothetical protein
VSARAVAALCVLAAAAAAGCKDEPAQPGTGESVRTDLTKPGGVVYGKPDAAAQPVLVADLAAKPEAYEGKLVRVEGTITDVCAKRGCWIKIGAEGVEKPVTFKVDDGVMVFPMDAKGKRVVADGTARGGGLAGVGAVVMDAR